MSETKEKGLMAFMSRHMMACDEAGFLVSKSFEAPIPFFKKISLRFHLMTCKLCLNYAKQLKQLNRVVTDYRDQCECSCRHHMSEDTKKGLHQKICKDSDVN